MTYNLTTLAKNLQINNIELLSFNTKEECLVYLKTQLNKNLHIGWGGSMTLNQCGLLDYLRNEKFPHLLDRDDPNLTATTELELQRRMFSCDVFFSSANALTEDGLIVNVDGVGNRVAATVYGPNKVYFVVGINKLVKDYAAAIARIRNHAAPLNARRLNLATPCVKTLTCHDCNSPQRICNYTTIIKRDMRPNRTTVLLINETLGF